MNFIALRIARKTDRQSSANILQESKESCERLVRLVSMFLNYSAAGGAAKLILAFTRK